MTSRTRGGDTRPNPQGKGLVPVLQDLQAPVLRRDSKTSPLTFFQDYCLSSLVLSARFNFKPVVDKPYYLYAATDGWTLSLVAHHEWGERPPGDYVGRCQLRENMTWEIEFEAQANTERVRRKLIEHVSAFVNMMEKSSEQDDIADTLPYYVPDLPYYQRVFATHLAGALRKSVPTSEEAARLLEQASRSTGWLLENDPRQEEHWRQPP